MVAGQVTNHKLLRRRSRAFLYRRLLDQPVRIHTIIRNHHEQRVKLLQSGSVCHILYQIPIIVGNYPLRMAAFRATNNARAVAFNDSTMMITIPNIQLEVLI